jgi:hypothetical protein
MRLGQTLDRAEEELALPGPVIGDVGEPEQVGDVGLELTVHQILVRGRPGRPLLALDLLAESAEPVVVRADPPHRAVARRQPLLAGRITEEAITELRVLLVGVEQSVGLRGLVPLRLVNGALSHR